MGGQRNRNEIDWRDTNMALFGSELEKRIKAASAGGERAWRGLGDKEELRIWRVEQFRVVSWPRRKFGKFHEGDSYIIFHAREKFPGRSDALQFDIYIWIGETSTADEYGTAAYKMAELDHFLGDRAIHHREVMEHESRGFLELFKDTGITYLEGGVDSGFNHVLALEDQQIKPSLYQVKGIREALVLREVKCRRDRMNSGDVFILDLQHTIFQWNGRQANLHEKRRALELVQSVVSERSGHCRSMTIDEGQNDDVDDFWNHIPGERRFLGFTVRKYDVQGELIGSDEKVREFRKILFRLSDASGKLKFKIRAKARKKGNKIGRKFVTSNDAFILDDGFHVWCFVGKDASSSERGLALSYAMKYIEAKGRPKCLPITMIREGHEPSSFTEHFIEKDARCLPWI